MGIQDTVDFIRSIGKPLQIEGTNSCQLVRNASSKGLIEVDGLRMPIWMTLVLDQADSVEGGIDITDESSDTLKSFEPLLGLEPDHTYDCAFRVDGGTPRLYMEVDEQLMLTGAACLEKDFPKGATRLYVSYARKDEAKALGARWEPNWRKWYAPMGADLTPFREAGFL